MSFDFLSEPASLQFMSSSTERGFSRSLTMLKASPRYLSYLHALIHKFVDFLN